MATLHIFATVVELDIPIMDMADLQSHIPAMPDNPSIFKLDAADFSQIITLAYGDPDRDHAIITVVSSNPKPKKHIYTSFQKATATFLELAHLELTRSAF